MAMTSDGDMGLVPSNYLENPPKKSCCGEFFDFHRKKIGKVNS